MTPLRQRMLNAMVLRGFAVLTHARYTLLGQTLLRQLRAHWRDRRPTTWRFASTPAYNRRASNQPSAPKAVERAFYAFLAACRTYKSFENSKLRLHQAMNLFAFGE